MSDSDEDVRSDHLPSEEEKKAETVTHIYFIGQLISGEDFFTHHRGLYVEAELCKGDSWELIDDKDKLNCGKIHTHTAYPDEEGVFVFAHPFEY